MEDARRASRDGLTALISREASNRRDPRARVPASDESDQLPLLVWPQIGQLIPYAHSSLRVHFDEFFGEVSIRLRGKEKHVVRSSEYHWLGTVRMQFFAGHHWL